MIRLPEFALFATALTAPSLALAQAPTVAAEHVWARATPPNAPTGAAYLTLTSAGEDRLVSVVTPVAGMAEIHENVVDGSIMKMRAVQGGIALPPGTPVSLAPGGFHIMLMEMKQPLKVGETFPLTLNFAKAASVTVRVTVQPIGATSDQVAHP